MQGESDNEVRGWAQARVINNNQFMSDILNKFEYTPHSVWEDEKNKVMWGEGTHAVEKSPRIASSNFFLPICWIDEISVSFPESGLAWDFLWPEQHCRNAAVSFGGPESWKLLLSLWWVSDDSCEEVQDAWRGPGWWDITWKERPLKENWDTPRDTPRSQTCPAQIYLQPPFSFWNKGQVNDSLKNESLTFFITPCMPKKVLRVCQRACDKALLETKIVSLIYDSTLGLNQLLEKLFWLPHYPSGCVRTPFLIFISKKSEYIPEYTFNLFLSLLSLVETKLNYYSQGTITFIFTI